MLSASSAEVLSGTRGSTGFLTDAVAQTQGSRGGVVALADLEGTAGASCRAKAGKADTADDPAEEAIKYCSLAGRDGRGTAETHCFLYPVANIDGTGQKAVVCPQGNMFLKPNEAVPSGGCAPPPPTV